MSISKTTVHLYDQYILRTVCNDSLYYVLSKDYRTY